ELIASSAIVLGAQSVSEHAGGAYTGEVSARMLAEWQCRYVIVGHNERRRMQQGSDVQVAEKVVAVQREQLTRILCGGVSRGQSGGEREGGDYTGEVSARMLEEMQGRYVIVGHNERRRMQQEADVQVAEKFIAVQREQLTPILCVGESLAQREAGQALPVIHRQLNAVLDLVGSDAFERAVVAYEPVWAVGTGKTATPQQAQEVHRYIREQLGEVGQRVRILYGGSVKADNAVQLFAMTDIDGALLGGASLNAEEFISICRAADV